jgi:hypothetical protein
MKKIKPLGGDTPQDFLDNQPFPVDVSEKVHDTDVALARHNLEVTLKNFTEKCFEAAKKCITEGKDHEAIMKMDDFVHKVYITEPRKMAEWESLMRQYKRNKGE